MSEEIKKEEVKAENAESTQDAETAQECTAEGDNEKSEKPDRKEKKLSKKLEAELAELKAQNEQLQKALDEEKDRALRIAAEYDNFRRRSKAEREGVYSDAYADAVNQILPIIDNLERAEGFDSAEEVKKGVVMILNGAKEALSKMGVEEIEAHGKEFDPNVHNAVMHTEDESFGENVICAVLQKGYKRGDKIIRYAMVQVAN